MTFIFRSSHFLFLVFCHFWQQSYENTKILRNLCLHFARQDGQDGKNREENHATKVTKIPKTKRRKYGMNETYLMKLHLNLVAQIEVIRYKNISNSKIVVLTNVCRNRIIKRLNLCVAESIGSI